MNKIKKNRLKSWHKWLGLPLSLFVILFALSGIVLNHREAVSSVDISRKWLPDYLTIDNWNQSSVKTTISIGEDSLLMYGGGIWLTDSRHSFVERFEAGMKSGDDNRNVAKIIRTPANDIFAVTTFDLYRFDQKTQSWQILSDLIDTDERLTDIAFCNDTMVVMSRSEIFTAVYPYTVFKNSQIAAPADYDGKVSLFRTMWLLHSGELFGFIGKLFVDLLGVFVILLSITGFIMFLFPKIVRYLHKRDKNVGLYISTLRPTYQWHNKLGYYLTAFVLILFISGTFLRPPLLIAIIRDRISPIPCSTFDSDNAWNDRLRCLNYDPHQGEWILYSSEGFFSFKTLDSQPIRIQNAPQVSVMGVNVMRQMTNNCWIIGSFDGLVLWDRQSGICVDYLTKQLITPRRPGPPNSNVAITGYSPDFIASDVVFGYSFGAQYIHSNGMFIEMSENDSPGDISLWHLALEVHTGRIFQPLIGFFTELYVFISGILLIAITLTGFFIYWKRKRRQKRIFRAHKTRESELDNTSNKTLAAKKDA